MFEYLAFYKYQLIIGGSLGISCAILGVFVLLQRQSIFAATMSQAGVLAFAFVVLGREWIAMHSGGSGGETSEHSANWMVLALNILLMAPFYVLRARGTTNFDAVLVAGIAFFSATAQILTVAGGLHTHLLNAYFGNILTVGVRDLWDVMFVLVPAAMVLIWIYRSLVAVSFDRDHAKLSGISVRWIDLLFFILLAAVAALTIRLMGSFYALAHIVLPGLFALAWTRSIRFALPVAALYSILATAGGFFVSLTPITMGDQTLNLPTSSVIVILLVLGCLPLALRRS